MTEHFLGGRPVALHVVTNSDLSVLWQELDLMSEEKDQFLACLGPPSPLVPPQCIIIEPVIKMTQKDVEAVSLQQMKHSRQGISPPLLRRSHRHFRLSLSGTRSNGSSPT